VGQRDVGKAGVGDGTVRRVRVPRLTGQTIGGVFPAPDPGVPVIVTQVPTLYIWGDADDTVGRAAAEGGDFVVVSYRFEVLVGIGHYPADQRPDRVNALMPRHLSQHPA
jgi:pimeloyl-ACP methyl ester carboxylesterase